MQDHDDDVDHPERSAEMPSTTAVDVQPAADDQAQKKVVIIRLPEADARSPSVLAGLLAKTPMSLTVLSLAGNGLDGSMSGPLRDFLPTRSALTALDLSGNQYSFLEKVFRTPSINATLQKLCLREIIPQSWVPATARALANTLASNSTLTHLDLRANELEYRTLRSLATLLQQCSALQVLELSGCAVSDGVAALMGRILTTSLTSLSVTTLSRKGAARIVEQATALKSLQLHGAWVRSGDRAIVGACFRALLHDGLFSSEEKQMLALGLALQLNTSLTALSLGEFRVTRKIGLLRSRDGLVASPMTPPWPKVRFLDALGLSSSQLEHIIGQCNDSQPLLTIQGEEHLDLWSAFQTINQFAHQVPKRVVLIIGNTFHNSKHTPCLDPRINGQLLDKKLQDSVMWLTQLEKAILTNNLGLTRPLRNTIKHMTNLQHLDLSNNALAMVSKYSLEKLTVLVLCGNQIRTLESRGFAGLPALTTLDLSDNMISEVDSVALQGLLNLSTLNLANNLIGDLSAVAWPKALSHSLTQLDLTRNPFMLTNERGLRPGCFSPLTSLERLLLCTHGQLNDLGINPRCIYSCVCVPHCALAKQVHNLNLCGRKVAQLPPGKELAVELDISFTQIRSLQELWRCGRLETLHASHLQLRKVELPEAVGRMLRVLDLSHNDLPMVTGKWDLPVLETLNLSYNRIKTIDPRAFSRLVQLRQLLLGHNAIGDSEARGFRKLFARCTALEELDLSHNRLSWAGRRAVGEGPVNSLRRLVLANNRITALEAHMCEGLKQLTDLDLSNNGLQTIEPSALLHVESSLTQLDLSFNLLNELPVGWTHRVARLETLDLSWNRFAQFPFDVLGMSSLKRLRLEGNRISESEIGHALSIWQHGTDFTLGLAPQLVQGQKFGGLLALCRGKTEYFEANLGQVPSEVAVPLPQVSSRACRLLALPVHPSRFTRDEVFDIWKASCYLDHTNRRREIRSLWEEYLTAGQDTAEDPLWKMLDAELADIVGMDEIKKKLRAIAGVLSMHYDQRSPSGDTQQARNPALKMDVVLQGNPGTGKTTIARLLGEIFFHLNLTKHEHMVEVQAPQLVSSYVNDTAEKTKKEINRARGGVLFLDEAYRLSPTTGSQQDHGREAIDTIMEHMSGDNSNPESAANVTFIFAGYKSEMAKFKTTNPGMFSRIAYTFDLPDYSPSELALIFEKHLDRHGWSIRRTSLQKIAKVFRQVPPAIRKDINARLVGHLFRVAQEWHALRWTTERTRFLQEGCEKKCALTRGFYKCQKCARRDKHETIGRRAFKLEDLQRGMNEWLKMNKKGADDGADDDADDDDDDDDGDGDGDGDDYYTDVDYTDADYTDADDTDDDYDGSASHGNLPAIRQFEPHGSSALQKRPRDPIEGDDPAAGPASSSSSSSSALLPGPAKRQKVEDQHEAHGSRDNPEQSTEQSEEVSSTTNKGWWWRFFPSSG